MQEAVSSLEPESSELKTKAALTFASKPLLRYSDPTRSGGIREVFDRRDIKVPGTLVSAEARFLDETEPRWKYNVGARTTLAEWLTAAENPFFARATVNRLWAHFFGLGLVELVDDAILNCSMN